MAKESQGLQIALIVFVILTIGVGRVDLHALQEDGRAHAQDQRRPPTIRPPPTRAAPRCKPTRTTLLRLCIGFAPSDKLDTITADFNKDMETYAGSLDATTRNYRKVLAYLNDELGKKNVALAEQQKSVQELKDAIARFETEKQPQIDETQAGQKAAIDDLASEREKFNTDRGAFTGQTTTIEDKLVKYEQRGRPGVQTRPN